MSRELFIGLAGPAGCGKGTVANIIKDIWNCQNGNFGKCNTFPLAAELKRIAKEEFGWDGNKDTKGRKLLQLLGTECGRMYGGENFWVDKWYTAISKWSCQFDLFAPVLVICDDVRFDNEAQRIKDLGGHIVLITGRGFDMGANQNHASEKGISKELVDYTIDNSGSMDNLANLTSSMLTHFNII